MPNLKISKKHQLIVYGDYSKINKKRIFKKEERKCTVSISSALSGNKIVFFQKPHGAEIDLKFLEWEYLII